LRYYWTCSRKGGQEGRRDVNKENSYNYSFKCGVESVSGDHLATQNLQRETNFKGISSL